MEMNQIRYFLAVCQHRNFTHAARASNVSQPSLTAAIKKLEGELGGALFLRDRAGCNLTPLGKLLEPRLQEVQRQTLEAKAEAVRYVRLDRVPISVGIHETIGQDNIAKSIERYRLDHPQADIELIVVTHRDLLDGLRAGRFDIAITSDTASDDSYQVFPLYEEDYQVVTAAEHPLSNQESVFLTELANVNLLDRLNCEMRETLVETCATRGITLYASYRSNRVDWLLALAREGFGAVILPESAIPDGCTLAALPFRDVEIRREVVALRYRHQPLRSEANALLLALQQ
ncbi:MAG: LysR family transcriptional regulator [Pseudomonadota bacterium]